MPSISRAHSFRTTIEHPRIAQPELVARSSWQDACRFAQDPCNSISLGVRKLSQILMLYDQRPPCRFRYIATPTRPRRHHPKAAHTRRIIPTGLEGLFRRKSFYPTAYLTHVNKRGVFPSFQIFSSGIPIVFRRLHIAPPSSAGQPMIPSEKHSLPQLGNEGNLRGVVLDHAVSYVVRFARFEGCDFCA